MHPDWASLPPSIIDLDDRGIVIYNRDDEPDVAKIDAMLAMTPTERLHWNEYWRRRVRNALRPRSE
ncbi:MAG TPA: hypothetical protein VKA46_30680 [Gemmataceae bacterium]|nr:hypothetical protein [Gemmataceae bacterium]